MIINKIKPHSDECKRKFYEERFCIICSKNFFVAKKGKCRRSTPGYVRQRNSKTCSSKCSRQHAINTGRLRK